MCTPVKPETVIHIRKYLQNYFDPKPYFISKRIQFYNTVQGKSESIQQYVKEIKELLTNCKFGDGQMERLRDKLVSGVVSNEVKQKYRLGWKFDVWQGFWNSNSSRTCYNRYKRRSAVIRNQLKKGNHSANERRRAKEQAGDRLAVKRQIEKWQSQLGLWGQKYILWQDKPHIFLL